MSGTFLDHNIRVNSVVTSYHMVGTGFLNVLKTLLCCASNFRSKLSSKPLRLVITLALRLLGILYFAECICLR